MEAIKTKGFARDGILSVPVPKEFEEKELEVIVLVSPQKNREADQERVLLPDEKVKKFHELPAEERLSVLEQYKGTAKYPDFPIDKYDVYDQ